MVFDNKCWQKAIDEVGKLYRENTKKVLLIAIDGKSGSGKTTLAGELQNIYGGNVFHMDDFFLRPVQRTGLRLAETGGNVDYERFGEILAQIRGAEKISYQRYDCQQQTLLPETLMEPKQLNVVEGSYSMHPYFGDIYDYRIVLDIDESEQRSRILKRNGEAMLERFVSEWIPKENDYFEKFEIFAKSDLIIEA